MAVAGIAETPIPRTCTGPHTRVMASLLGLADYASGSDDQSTPLAVGRLSRSEVPAEGRAGVSFADAAPGLKAEETKGGAGVNDDAQAGSEGRNVEHTGSIHPAPATLSSSLVPSLPLSLSSSLLFSADVPAPPSAPPSLAAQQAVARYMGLQRDSGFQLVQNLRGHKELGNPYLFDEVASHFRIQQAGTRFTPDAFDPAEITPEQLERRSKRRRFARATPAPAAPAASSASLSAAAASAGAIAAHTAVATDVVDSASLAAAVAAATANVRSQQRAQQQGAVPRQSRWG
ncbi:hypothetical protein B484DRAFT_113311 [Ochromonadaceae sp. CCMP2298]|nr:hypothetical protein B484DRAFT_113311 [Ochromonadaceae sp. CCMP2298]